MPRTKIASHQWRSLVDLLRQRARENPDRALFTFLAEGEPDVASVLTRGALDRSARGLAARLQELGLAGERAVLLFPPGLEFLTAFFGCLYAGVIPAPTAPPRRDRPMPRLRSIAADARPRALLTTAELLDDADKWQAGAPELAGGIRLAVDEPGLDALADGWRDPGASPETLAFLQYTSGSTADPKGVMITHGNLLHNSALIRACFGSTADSRGVFWLPLFHDMGLIGGVIQTIYCGGSSTLLSPVAFLQRPLRWLQAISDTGATISGGPNFAYDLCVEKIGPEQRADLDLSRWCVAFNGAEPIRAETLERFAEAFAPCGFDPEAFLPCYGLAEATLLVSGGRTGAPSVISINGEAISRGEAVLSEDPTARHVVGSGQVVEGERVEVVDPVTRLPCPDGRVGEIWVQSPSVAMGYWGRDEVSEATFQAALATNAGEGPFLRTGDLGFLRDGTLFVTGRIKDLIILRGRNIYPQDLEWTAERSHPALRASGAAAIAIDAGGQERLAIVAEVDRLGRRYPADDVIEAVRRSIAEEHDLDVFAIRLIKPLTLPRTSSGKVRRHACREAFATNELEVVAAWTRQEVASPAEAAHAEPDDDQPDPRFGPGRAEIAAWLAEKVAELLGIAASEIDPRRPLAGYGLGSLQAVRLAGELETWLGRQLSPTLAYEHPTIDSLARHLAGEPEASPSYARAASQAAGPIAIIGVGCRFPGADGPEAFWALLRDGVEAVKPVPTSHRNAQRLAAEAGARRAGFLAKVDEFDADFFGIAPREAAYLDPQQRLLLETTWEALEDAGHVPERLAGSEVGVFIGIATNDYAQLQAKRGPARDAYHITGGAASLAANRLSYALDLRGPSLAVDTACSSSLVAVHLACKSLRDGESSLAIAGGVNLILSPEVDAGFARAGFLAPDGRCKTFDASANGYARGEGAGVVVLKPLARALADGDPVYAVIVGSAVNQDGRTNGLTAPSRSAQEAVLQDAYRAAGVRPADVAYVEAHGTGTLLGDPIELSALGTVLSQGRPADRPCILGSVKTNIGHLEAAAGIAGLIKTALALRHGTIPPSLNFSAPNPHVAFDALGLRVATSPAPWPVGDGLPIAGVSSFGFGGTNAHLVLQAVDERGEAAGTRGSEPEVEVLVPLSARSPEALRALEQAWLERLDQGRLGDLRDVAYTASVRRSHHDDRVGLVVKNEAELRAQLEAALGERAHRRGTAGRRVPIAFVFSGQGGLWRQAGRGLLASEAGFRNALGECESVVRSLAGWSLLDELGAEERQSRIGQTEVAQPLQFSLQVALAALWKSWGIVPEAVVGHSLGEVAAAHFAGVLTLEEAARIAVERGRLMQAAAGRGRTAAVGLSATDVERRIAGDRRLAIAAVNGPNATTVSGDTDAVLGLVEALRAEGRLARVLDVDCAFHGPQMDEARRGLESALAGLAPRAAKVRLVSTVTGAEVTGQEFDAGYWGRNVRETVRFADAVRALGVGGIDVFLEIGTHPIHGTAIAETLEASEPLVLPSLRRGDAGRGTLLRSLAGLYARGVDPAWENVAPAGRHVRLPSYPWQRERFWFDEGEESAQETEVRPEAKNPVSRDLYEVRWEARERVLPEPAVFEGHWMVVGEAGGLAEALRRRIEAGGGTCSVVRAGEEPRLESGEARRGVVDLRALDRPDGGRLCEGVVRLVQTLAKGTRLWIATRGAQAVGDGVVSAAQATLWGLGRSVGQEHPELWGGLIDLDPAGGDDLAALLGLIGGVGEEDQHAFRGGRVYVPRLQAVEGSESQPVVIRPGGTYLVTGGLGDLGLQTARWLVGRGARRLVLVGRSAVPDRMLWDELEPEHPAYGRVVAIRELEEQGATVWTVAVDVADAEGMARLFAELRRAWPPLRGIIHAAGLVEPKAVGELEAEGMRRTLRPKVEGTRVLDELSRGLPLDLFVLFSSVSSVWGSARLVDYAAANAFLDGVAHARRAEGLPALSVNWGPWGGGMAGEAGRGRSLALLGLKPLEAETAFAALDRLLGMGMAQATVADVEWTTFKALHNRGGRGRFFEGIADRTEGQKPAEGSRAEALRGLPVERRREEVSKLFREQVGRVLGMAPERIEEDRPLTNLGLDSLMAMELRNAIEAELGPVLPLSVLLQGPSLAVMSEEAAKRLGEGVVRNARSTQTEVGDGTLALSPGQRMMFYAVLYEPTGAVYNLSGGAQVSSPLDVGAISRALKRLVWRHDALCTTFFLVQGTPVGRVQEAGEFAARQEEWFLVEDAGGWTEAEIERGLVERARRPFDLQRGPLFRVHLLKKGEDDHILLLVFHHIIGDFWSTAVLLDEFGALYEEEVGGRPAELGALRLSYADAVRLQAEAVEGEAGEARWAYWRDRLAGRLPVLELPTDRTRPAVRSYRGATRHFHLDEGLTRGIVALGESRGASLYTMLLAAFQVLLARYSGQKDLIVGSPVSGRTRAGMEELVGYFVNMLPMRADLSGNPKFDEHLAQVRRDVVDALEQQEFPFGLMVQRLVPAPDPSRPPLFQAAFIHQKAQRLDEQGLTPFALSSSGPRMNLRGLSLESVVVDKQTALFDLTLMTARDGDRLACALEYSTDLFEPATMDRLAESFQVLLEGLVADPEGRVWDVPLVSGAERGRLVEIGVGPALGLGRAESAVHRRVEAQAARKPEAVALVHGHRRLTYGELNARANRLARRLIERGVGPETVVGLCVERSASMLIGVLGILKAGGAYLPVDPEQPRERLGAMLEDAGVSLVLVQEGLRDRVPRGAAEVVGFETLDETTGPEDAVNPDVRVEPKSLAYVIFTSGSTGRPKGVMVEHRALANAAEAWEQAYGLGPGLRHLQAAGFAFDVFTGDWTRALTTGGTLVDCPKAVLLDPEALLGLIREERIDCVELVPAVAELVAGEAEREAGGKSGQHGGGVELVGGAHRTGDADRRGLEVVGGAHPTGEDGEGESGALGRGADGRGESGGLRRPEVGSTHPTGLAVGLVAVGSDMLRGGLYRRLQRLVGPSGRVVNSYGLTEATIDSTCFEGAVEGSDDRPVPIGRPLPGMRVYVLDERMQPVPLGVPGELYIGGEGVARGYAGDPGRTAERFVPDPFGEAGARLYRSGDRARWRDGGVLELLGRTDHQVKVRGYRIELGEVEAALRRHEQVREVVVVAVGNTGGDRRLAAYVVAAAPGLVAAELRRWLRDRLPEPMVPGSIQMLEALPLLANGKVDRAALPAPAADEPALVEYVAPRNGAEETLARITADLLGHNHIGVDENFFEIGIDSILGVQMISRARQAGLPLSPAHLFRHPTIAGLAAALVVESPDQGRAGRGTGHSGATEGQDAARTFGMVPEDVDLEAVRRELGGDGGIEDLYPLTPVQEGMLFHSLSDPEAGVYVEQFVCRIRGVLDRRAFEEAWARLIARHPALRTAIHWSESGRPYQAVHRRAEMAIGAHDWRGLSGEERDRRLQAFLQEDRRSGFVAAWPPLMRAALMQLEDDVHQLVWSIHHVMIDGWCLSILLHELIELYEAIGRGAEPELASSPPFRDYVAWLRGQDAGRAEAYWRSALRGIRAPTPLGLEPATVEHGDPGDEPVSEWEMQVDGRSTAALVSLARRGRITLSTVIQGAWALLLGRYSGQDEVVFGVTVSGRPAELPGVEGMVGMFINTLPARVAIAEEAPLLDWLRGVQDSVAEMRRFETSPPAQVQAWSEVARGQPIFESIVVFQNLPHDTALRDRAGRLGIESARYLERTHYPLALTVIPGEELHLRLGYDARRFDRAGVERMLGHLGNLLEAIAEGGGAERRIADLPLLTDSEHEELLRRWAGPDPLEAVDLDGLTEEEIETLYERLR